MITTDNVQVTRAEIISITCDKCGTAFTPDNFIEFQEFHHINFTGGYGSVFGDESKVEADICQRCLNTLIYDFCRINGIKAKEAVKKCPMS